MSLFPEILSAGITSLGSQTGMDPYGHDSMASNGFPSVAHSGYDFTSVTSFGYGRINRLGYEGLGGYPADEGTLSTLGGYGSMGPCRMRGYSFMGAGSRNPLGNLGTMTPGGFVSVNNGMSGHMTADYGPLGYQLGSMYGMGGPLKATYGIEVPTGSMHISRGSSMSFLYSRGSRHDFGSMYGLGLYKSTETSSNSLSMYRVAHTTRRASFRSSGGYVGGNFGGLWRAPSVSDARPKQDPSIPSASSFFEEMPEEADDEAARDVVCKAGGLGVSSRKVSEASPRVADVKTRAAAVKKGNNKRNSLRESTAEKNDKVANNERFSRRTRPKAIPSSHGLTKQINDHVHAIAVVREESALSGTGMSVSVGKMAYKMDEVLAAPVGVEQSDLLTDIVGQVCCGHNVSLLVLCGAQSYVSGTDTIAAVVRRTMDSFAVDKTQSTHVKASAVAFNESSNIVDLLKIDRKPVKAEMGYNPIYGTCVVNTSERDIKSAKDAVDVVMSAVKNADDEGLVVVLYKIKQIRRSPASGTGRDVFVSSMLVAFVADASMHHLNLTEKHTATEPGLMFTNAIGGASRTVVIVQVPSENAEELIKDAVAYSQKLREITNTPTRSGNVKRFIDYTERAAAANASACPETTTSIRQMLKDAKELLAQPEETLLVAYRLFRNINSKTEPDTKPHVHGALSETADAPEQRTGEDAPPVPPPAQGPNEGKVVDPAAIFADTTVTPETDLERQMHLVVCVEGAITIPLGRLRVNEVVVRGDTAEMPECEMLRMLRDVFGKGRNIALVAAETRSSEPLKDQYTWMCVADILTKSLESTPAHAKSTCIELFMSVVLKRQILCDLMEDRAASVGPKSLDTASSPLFGPVFAGTINKTLRRGSEVTSVLAQALDGASNHLTDPDSMIVMTAVLKQVQTNSDVFVASFMAASGASTDGLCRAISKKSVDHSNCYLSYALRGPSVTSLLVCVGKECELSELAQVSLTDMQVLAGQPIHTSRGGSVMAFVDYAKERLKRTKTRLENAEGEERERLMTISKRLQMMHDDYRTFLQFPMERMPAYYLGEGHGSPARRIEEDYREKEIMGAAPAREKMEMDAEVTRRAPIRAVVVVTDGDEDSNGHPGKSPVLVKGRELVVNGQRYTPTEVVAAKGRSFRSSVVNEIHNIVLEGYNAGMLTSDIGGSTVGISMVLKTINMILGRLPENSEAFWSATVSKGGQVRDMLAEHSSYYDLHIASSPLFGNVPYGARIVPVERAQVMPTLWEMRNEIHKRGGLGYMSVILRLVQSNGDVCVPSLIATIAEDEIGAYEEMISTRSSSALLGSVIGGTCNSIYVAGILSKQGDLALPSLQLAEKMMRVHNGPLRSGSLKRFIAHTEPALEAMQQKIESRDGTCNPKLMKQLRRIRTMISDAQRMLSSPGGLIPAVYRR